MITDQDLERWRFSADDWAQARIGGAYRRYRPKLVNLSTGDDELRAYIDAEVSREIVEYPAQDVYFFRDCWVTDSCFILSESGVLFEPSAFDNGQPPLATTEVLESWSGAPILKGPHAFIWKAGKNNYGHVLVEMLPRIDGILGVLPGKVKLLVPSLSPPIWDTVSWLIEKMYPNRFELVLMVDQVVKVEQLVYAGPVTRHNNQKSPAVTEFAHRALAACGATPGAGRRLYVSRENVSSRRMINEAELSEQLVEQGFQKVYPEQLTVEEQIQLFADADEVVGPLGAGMTNIMFAPDHCRIHLIDPGTYDFFFCDLASLKRQHLDWYFCGSVFRFTTEILHREYEIPDSTIKELLARIGQTNKNRS